MVGRSRTLRLDFDECVEKGFTLFINLFKLPFWAIGALCAALEKKEENNGETDYNKIWGIHPNGETPKISKND